MDKELAIIGAGSAGYTAAIYAGRAGLDAVVFDKGTGGGLATWAPFVENYPGFKHITGLELMDRMKEHAQEYAQFNMFEEVTDLVREQDDTYVQVISSKDKYEVGAVIIATGAVHKQLNVPGEKNLRGRGISYCATCDGSFFKDKQVAVIGGGNSAVNEALYLHHLGCKVTIIHRRNQLRAEEALEAEVRNQNIAIIWNSMVEEILGGDKVTGLLIKNRETEEITTFSVDGVFISIGEMPQSALAERVGAETYGLGYIRIDRMQRTTVPRILAAGDVTGGMRQIVTACAEGALASMTAMDILGKQYPF
jgi:thioredoxin reductase (NADPH)